MNMSEIASESESELEWVRKDGIDEGKEEREE